MGNHSNTGQSPNVRPFVMAPEIGSVVLFNMLIDYESVESRNIWAHNVAMTCYGLS